MNKGFQFRGFLFYNSIGRLSASRDLLAQWSFAQINTKQTSKCREEPFACITGVAAGQPICPSQLEVTHDDP